MTRMARMSSSGASSICQRNEMLPMNFICTTYIEGLGTAARLGLSRLLGVGAGLEDEPVVHFPVGGLVLQFPGRRILHHVFDPSGRFRLGRVHQIFYVELAGRVGLIQTI